MGRRKIKHKNMGIGFQKYGTAVFLCFLSVLSVSFVCHFTWWDITEAHMLKIFTASTMAFWYHSFGINYYYCHVLPFCGALRVLGLCVFGYNPFLPYCYTSNRFQENQAIPHSSPIIRMKNSTWYLTPNLKNKRYKARRWFFVYRCLVLYRCRF